MGRSRRPSAASLRVAFCHPDLGLGGAERLIVDAAVELAALGHQVDVFTAFHDPERCFEETVAGPFSVTVAGGWFPRHIAGRAHALCAYIRCTLVALFIAWRCWRCGQQYDVIIVDQVSVVNWVLRALTTARILFYCHFPDLLLARRQSCVHAAYRMPLDWVEQSSTGAAHLILVNSAFTQGVFAQTFKRLHARAIRPAVLHPAVSIPDSRQLQKAESGWQHGLPANMVAFIRGGPTFLSINRFERKKGIGLGIQALQQLRQGGAGQPHAACRLILAGGYDPRLPENVEHLRELQQLAEQHGVAQHVRFLPSFTDGQRSWLLAACTAVLYTPQHEHFGIVPLEAMAAGRPVVACNSGGPMESVLSGQTGFLCEPRAERWAEAMAMLLTGTTAQRMGHAARQHVQDNFSRAAFGQKLNNFIIQLARQGADMGPGSKRR